MLCTWSVKMKIASGKRLDMHDRRDSVYVLSFENTGDLEMSLSWRTRAHMAD